MNKLVSKNPVLRFKLGKKIVKAKDGWLSKLWSEIKNTDLAYIDNPSVMTAAGHTAKVSEVHAPTQAERLLGNNLALIGFAGATGAAGNALATGRYVTIALKALPGMQRALPGRVVTPNTPAVIGRLVGFTTPQEGLTIGLKIWRGIGGTTLLTMPFVAGMQTFDTSPSVVSLQASQNNQSTKEYIPLGQVAATREKYLEKGNILQGNLPGQIQGVNDIDTQMKINSLPSNGATSPKFYGTGIGGRVQARGNNFNNLISAKQRQKLIGTGKFNDADFADVKSFQNALNRYFANDAKYGAGQVKVDNLWGNQTQKAFNLALSKVDSPQIAGGVGSNPTIFTVPQLPTIPAQLSKINVETPTRTFNRSEIRQYMRDRGLNPYLFTGAQRKALRMIMNGQGTDKDKAVVQGMGIFKKGGNILPSRDPITRFKNRNFRMSAQ